VRRKKTPRLSSFGAVPGEAEQRPCHARPIRQDSDCVRSGASCRQKYPVSSKKTGQSLDEVRSNCTARHAGVVCRGKAFVRRKSGEQQLERSPRDCQLARVLERYVDLDVFQHEAPARAAQHSNAHKRLLVTDLSLGCFCRPVEERSAETRFVTHKQQGAILILPGIVVTGNCTPQGWCEGNRASFNSVLDHER